MGVIFDCILNRTASPPIRVNPHVPADLERIINKCLEKDRNLRYQHASDIRTDLQRLKRDTDSSRISSSANRTVQEVAAEPRTQSVAAKVRLPAKFIVAAACIALLAAALVLHRLWSRSNTPIGPAKISQISQWNKSMNYATLSPDGHAVAFGSPIGGVSQVFLMLTSGGEPLQLTNDEGDKGVDSFSADGKEVLFERNLGRDEIWAVPTLGGSPRRVASGSWARPSPDGASIYYTKSDRHGIFRAAKSGLDEELVYEAEDPSLYSAPLLLFPGGNHLLASIWRSRSDSGRFIKINLIGHQVTDLGEVSRNLDVVWAELGKSVLFSRTVNGLTNIWKYNLEDRSLMRITFGTGPDYSPMPDPGGKGIYYVNGKSSGFLTVYHVHSKESMDIVSEDTTAPLISRDGKRVMYITFPAQQRTELWVSDIDGGNKVRIATGEDLDTGSWAPDNFHLTFFEGGAGARNKAYIIGADGSGLRQLPPVGHMPIIWPIWSPDQKAVYATTLEFASKEIWKWNDSSSPEKVVDKCGYAADVDPSGQYILGWIGFGEGTGIYETSTSERKCIPLLPGAVTLLPYFARDGKSLLYAVASRGQVMIYRQPWREGKLVGAAQVALKVPFVFPLYYQGNAYDFSRDLSTIVYARPGGHADLYLLNQK